jgi:hypothetical protein
MTFKCRVAGEVPVNITYIYAKDVVEVNKSGEADCTIPEHLTTPQRGHHCLIFYTLKQVHV